MATWEQFAQEAPELAEAVRARFEVTKHHVLATLRLDGSPRVSGTEVHWDGPDLVIGSMWHAVKAKDLLRDARFALHANPGDGSMEGGDAKVSGRAVETPAEADPEVPSHRFCLDLGEVVLTRIHPAGDRLVVESWKPGAPPTSVDRF